MAKYENFFRHTFGRWIHEEERQLALRYRRFNVEALQQVAASTLSSPVAQMRKIAEGRHNKVFLLAMENGKELIARLPTPIAGPEKLVTKSEVATMAFARERLGLPVPRVLAHCSDGAHTPVGAEFIIMEKAPGIELGRVWDGLSASLRHSVVTEWTRLEQIVLSNRLHGGLGSLYFRDDIPATCSRRLYINGVADKEFVIGPSTNTAFWNDGRKNLDINRGPWNDTLSYLRALAARETKWIPIHAVKNPDPGPFDLPVHLQDVQMHLRLLDMYRSVAPYLVPSDPELLRPALWYTDVHLGNIFLSPESLSNGIAKITAIIDWQHTSVLPLYLQARVPRLVRHNPTSTMDSHPELVDLHKFYLAQTTSVSRAYSNAFTFPHQGLFIHTPFFAGATWDNGIVPLRHCLFRIAAVWPDLVSYESVPCPIQFSPEEQVQHEKDAAEWQQAQDGKAQFNMRIGVDEEGWVEPENYDDAVKANEEFQKEYAAMLDDPKEAEEFLRVWPYRPAHTLSVSR